MRSSLCLRVAFVVAAFAGPAVAVDQATTQPTRRSMIDYFLPIPVKGELSKDVWGAADVGPRDPDNGLEDRENKQWCYWDGAALKSADGKWHLYASKWEESRGHRGWGKSVGVHAVSDDVLGPYVDKGLLWPTSHAGKGHNVTAMMMHDGRYAVVISQTRPGEVFASKSPDGPFESLGIITVKDESAWKAANLSPLLRPDGRYMMVERHGRVMLADNIVGPYTFAGPTIYKTVKGMPQSKLEDPLVWYSGGLYHLVVNSWDMRKAFHATSANGIDGWTLRGLAYDPTVDFIRHTDGTVNRWNKLERPGVVVQDGHVTHFLFSVVDVPKERELGNDRHGSKVILVPFDGEALDRDLAEIVRRESGKPAAE